MKAQEEPKTSENGLAEDELNASIAALERSGQRRKNLTRLLVALLAIPLLAGSAFFMVDVVHPDVGQHIRGVLSGEQNLVGQRKFTPTQPLSPAEFEAAIDMQGVHGDLMAAWLVSKSKDTPGSTSERTHTHFEALRDAISNDLNLLKIVAELGDIVHAGVDEKNIDRLSYLVWAWNDYLRQQEQPYYFETGVVTGRDEPMVYVKNYSLVTELPFSLTVGGGDKAPDRSVNGLITQRSDRTNVVENYLCRATSATQRPLWIVDTAQRDAAEHIWPMLSPTNDVTLTPAQKGFAPAIRREAKKRLSPESLATLERTASARHRVLQTIAAINKRGCQDFYISDVPRITYTRAEFQRLSRFAAGGECPRVSNDELDFLVETAQHLHPEVDAIENALAELAAWTIRPHVVHEVRHYFDATRPFAELRPLACPGCEEPMGAPQNEELHAYLAAIAYSDAPVMGAFLACQVATTTETMHKFALAPLVDHLMKNQSCDEGPAASDSADALRDAAINAETQLFGHAETIRAEADWPDQLASHADE